MARLVGLIVFFALVWFAIALVVVEAFRTLPQGTLLQ
jgi:hypothetical protein